jgi:hypothetical protein
MNEKLGPQPATDVRLPLMANIIEQFGRQNDELWERLIILQHKLNDLNGNEESLVKPSENIPVGTVVGQLQAQADRLRISNGKLHELLSRLSEVI